MLCECIFIYVNFYEFMWIKTRLFGCTSICMNINMILYNSVSNYLIYSEFIRIHTIVFWIYSNFCSLPDCRTRPHRWTAAHCHMHCRTAAHCCPNCSTAKHIQPCALLTHIAWIWMSDRCTPHMSHTVIYINWNNYDIKWMCMHLHEFIYEFVWIKTMLCKCVRININNINMIYYNLISFFLDLFRFHTTRFYTNMFWIYLKILHTVGQ
jgi:hypothetical protein